MDLKRLPECSCEDTKTYCQLVQECRLLFDTCVRNGSEGLGFVIVLLLCGVVAQLVWVLFGLTRDFEPVWESDR